jgi:hypothetical protein
MTKISPLKNKISNVDTRPRETWVTFGFFFFTVLHFFLFYFILFFK